MFARKKVPGAFILTSGFLFILPTFADAPSEKYHVAYRDISTEVLQNTIGILTINPGAKKGTSLRIYLRQADRFVPDSLLKVLETTPISNFGYHNPEGTSKIENYRYPIIEMIGRHARIVYDPVKNLSAWIDLDEMEKDFFTTVTLLNALNESLPYYVDIFCFTESSRRKIYKSPAKGAEYFIAAKSDRRYGLLKVMEIGEGFVKVGNPRFNSESFELEGVDPIGWMRIRDDQGRLTFWINDADGC